MANDKETVKKFCDWLRQFRVCDGDYIREIEHLADEAEAAHTREIEAKDAEIGKLRECLREAVEWACGNPNENCTDCVAHGGDTPCKCETWRKMLEGGQK